ncbi:hypothetical protein [Lignipirellula cremea]|uniref:Uncharacterized protein n=1 Tax=Lignipirellula cremea TaxID=2528010 RepID=A0A518DQA9_9BACT|nr:hypothetical protein [Lignipirellula cremea]QDU94023.1 hypothetical protein Pla8534_18090 [Lignipirellula cremea]
MRHLLLLGLMAVLLPSFALAEDSSPDIQPFDFSQWDDPAMNGMVDIGLLADALAERDAALVTDVALQLSRAERILLRSHPKITSEQLFRTAATMARNVGDKQTLARLQKAAAATGNKAMASELAAAQALGGASRAVIPAPEIPADVNPDDLGELQEIQFQIQLAEDTGDKESLADLREIVGKSELSADITGWLTKMIDRADKSVGEGTGEQGRSLVLLTDASRGWPSPSNYDPFNSNNHYGGHIKTPVGLPTYRRENQQSWNHLPSNVNPPKNPYQGQYFNSGPQGFKKFQGSASQQRDARFGYQNGSRTGGKKLGTFNLDAYRQQRLGGY